MVASTTQMTKVKITTINLCALIMVRSWLEEYAFTRSDKSASVIVSVKCQ